MEDYSLLTIVSHTHLYLIYIEYELLDTHSTQWEDPRKQQQTTNKSKNSVSKRRGRMGGDRGEREREGGIGSEREGSERRRMGGDRE